MHHEIKPVTPTSILFGPAKTIKTQSGQIKSVLQALYTVKEGEILVIDAQNGLEHAVLNSLMIEMAQLLGVQGIVTNSVIQLSDYEKCKDYAIFCRGLSVAMGNNDLMGKTDVNIECGEVTVKPGDFILGDRNGVVVIPQQDLQRVMAEMEARSKSYDSWKQKILNDRNSVKKYLKEISEVDHSYTNL